LTIILQVIAQEV